MADPFSTGISGQPYAAPQAPAAPAQPQAPAAPQFGAPQFGAPPGGPALGPTTRPFGFTAADLTNPTIARGLMPPMPYAQAYPQVGGGGLAVSQPFTPSAGGGGTAAPLTQAKDFSQLGKTSTLLVNQPSSELQPGEVQASPYAPPAPQAPPGSGLDAFMRAIVGPLTGFLPPDLQQNLLNGLGTVANLISIPLSWVGNAMPLPFSAQTLPGFSPDKAGVFSSLPETPEKGRAEAAASRDPANALYYMAQYLKNNEFEVAKGMGVDPLFADYYLPIDNLGDQVMKTLGLLGIPQRIIARTWSGQQAAMTDQRILNVDPATLRPDLLPIRQAYESGQISHDQFLDEITKAGASASNDPFQQLLFDMISDPLNLTMVGGVAEKLAATSSKADQIGRTVALAMKDTSGVTEAEQLAMHTYAADEYIAQKASQGVSVTPEEALPFGRDSTKFQWLMDNGHADLADQALATMSTKQRALITLDPVIGAAAKMGKAFNAPFDLFGKATGYLTRDFHNYERIQAYSSRMSVEGVVRAYDPSNVLSVKNFFDSMGAGEAFTDGLGRMGADMEMQTHADAMTRMVRENGGIPKGVDPTDAARAMSEVSSDRLAIQTQGRTQRIMDQYIEGDQTGPGAIDSAMTRQRKVAAEQIGTMVGPNADMTKITAFAERLNEKQLAFVNHMAYAGEPVLKSFLAAKGLAREAKGAELDALRQRISQGATPTGRLTRGQQRAAALEAQQSIFSRMTVIGPHTLDTAAARAVLRAVKSRDATAVRAYVERYTILMNNFASRGLTDEELLQDMGVFIQDLLGKNNKGEALVNVITRDKLPPPLRDWYDKQKAFAQRAGTKESYRVGLAPSMDNRWRAVFDGEGKLIGVNAWVDSMGDVANVPNLSSLASVRTQLLAPIRGEQILEQARRDFRTYGVREYGLSRAEADRLFGRIRQRTTEAGTMPRGLTNGELMDLTQKMSLDPVTMQKLGQRGVARLVAKAFEGDAMVVGITQKISGKGKTFMSNRMGNNWLGVVAERLYPLARFTYNPIFLIQEAVEPFFWNIMKGIKPGLRWGPEDIKSMESLRRSGFLGEWADQAEFSPTALMAFASQESRRIAGDNTFFGRAWGSIIGEGRRVQSLAEVKRLNYIRNVNRNFGRSFHEAINNLNPAFWDQLIREAGTTDEGRIANYYWESKALGSPDDAHVQTWLMDATVPHTMGATMPVVTNQLARFHQFTDMVGLRKAVKDSTYTEAMFRDKMSQIGADAAYTDRAWNMAVHEGAQKWWEGYVNAKTEQLGGSGTALKTARAESAATRKIWQARAKAVGISEDEYLSRFSANSPLYVDSTGKLPNGSRFQMAQPEEVLKFYDHELLPPDHEIVRRISTEARAVGTPAREYDAAVLDRLSADGTAEAAAPEGHTLIGDPNDPVHIIGSKTYEEGMKMADGAVGQNIQEKAALAHRRMASMFYTITDMLPQDLLHELTYKFIAQPFDYHFHRLRVEAKEAQNFLSYTGNLFGADETTIRAAMRSRDPAHGSNFFADNAQIIEDNGGALMGPANTGVKVEVAGAPGGWVFGWYDENGELASTAWVSIHKQYPFNRLAVPGAPGEGIARVGQPQNLNAESRTVEEALPKTQGEMADMMQGGLGEAPTDVNQPYVEYVGVRSDARGKGYYNKMTDYIQNEGTVNWADATGRGSYTQQGSPAAAAWLAKKDKESQQAMREAVAARMLTGYTHLIGQRALDPEEALASLQGVIEMLGGRTKSAMQPAQQLMANMMDLSRYHVDPLMEMSEQGLDALSEQYQVAHTWRQQETLNALTGKGDTIVPSEESARAFGYADSQVAHGLMRGGQDVVRAGADIPEAERLGGRMTDITNASEADLRAANAEARNILGTSGKLLEVTPEMHAHMRDTYRQWAQKANGEQRLGRTDWTARDMQNIDLGRYRQVTKMDAVPYDDPRLLLQDRSAIIHFQLEPHQFSADYASAFPNQTEALQRGAYGSLAAYRTGMDNIHREVGAKLAKWLPEASGVSIAHVSVGPINRKIVDVTPAEEFTSRADAERWAAADLTPKEVQGMKDRGEWDNFVTDFIAGDSDATGAYSTQFQALGSGLSLVVTGTDESIEKAVAAVGAAYQQGEVWATGITSLTPEEALRPWEERRLAQNPDVVSGWRDMWVTDFKIDPASGMSENIVAANVDQLMADRWAADLDPGRVTIANPDGTRAIRALHEGTDTQIWRIGTRPYPMDAEDLDALYPIPHGTADMFQKAGITIERKMVRSYMHRVDLEAQQGRSNDVARWLDQQGEFHEPATGETVTKTANFGTEWDTRSLHRANEWTDPWLQHIESKGWTDLHAALRNRYRGQALAEANQSYWRHLPEFTAEHRALDQILPPVLRGWHYQTGARGVRAATYVDSNEKAAMFFLKHAGPDSALHETFHTFVPQLDESAIRGLAKSYADATGKRVYLSTSGAKAQLTSKAEEWLAEEFVKYATTGAVKDAKLQSAFNYFGKSYKADAHLKTLATAHPDVSSLFDQMLGQANSGASAVPFNPDEWRYLSTARNLLGAAEDAAHKTHYFARGRNLLERSINHPYMGYYPASYMWGKVVPELVNFLIREPFGVRAPMWGYGMSMHVAQAVALQLNTDQDFKDWVTNHPHLIQFAMMMLPGTPWDIPVNAPSWARHLAATEATNPARVAAGMKPQHGDFLREVASSANYALGAARFLQTGGQILNEFNPTSSANQPSALPGAAPQVAPLAQDLVGAQAELTPLLNSYVR